MRVPLTGRHRKFVGGTGCRPEVRHGPFVSSPLSRGPRRRAARQRARDERPMTYFRAAASSPHELSVATSKGDTHGTSTYQGASQAFLLSGKARLIPHGRGRDGPRNGGTVSDKPHEKPSRP